MSVTRHARIYRAAAACVAAVAVVTAFAFVVGMLPGLTMALIFGGAKALELGLGAAAALAITISLVVAATTVAWHAHGRAHSQSSRL